MQCMIACASENTKKNIVAECACPGVRSGLKGH